MSRDYKTRYLEIRRNLLVGGIRLAGFTLMLLLLISFRSFTGRLDGRSFRDTLKAVKSTSVRPIAKGFSPPIMYTNRLAPCALDESTSAAAVRAIQDHDQRALDRLLTRRTLISLSTGTMFDVDSTRHDVIWGFVRGGPNTGEYCSVIASFLSSTE